MTQNIFIYAYLTTTILLVISTFLSERRSFKFTKDAMEHSSFKIKLLKEELSCQIESQDNIAETLAETNTNVMELTKSIAILKTRIEKLEKKEAPKRIRTTKVKKA